MSARSERRLLALDLPPGRAFIEALDRAWQRGDAVLPLDPAAPDAAKRRVLAAMRPHAVIDHSGEAPYADPAQLDADVALVIATSGSTGEPKGAQLSHSALAASADATALRLGQETTDRWLSCLPWQHIGGLQVLLRARRAGLPVQVLEKFDVDSVAAAIAAGATLTSLVPTTLRRVFDAGVDVSSMKAVLLGGSSAPRRLLDDARTLGAPVVTTYGMSETCGGCVYDGLPLDGVEARIAEDGRVEISGPTLLTGYRLRPDLDAETMRHGWLRTGDVGQLSEDGRLRVLGRADDIIITGGEKVVGPMLAEQIARHPAVVAVAVTGVADEEWGQRVVAVVELREGRSLQLRELRDWLADRLPSWSLPRSLVAVDRLPQLPSGKPDRLAVQRLAVQRLADQPG